MKYNTGTSRMLPQTTLQRTALAAMIAWALVTSCTSRQTLPTDLDKPIRTAVIRIQAPPWHTVDSHRALESMLRRDLARTGLAARTSRGDKNADWFLEGEILEGIRTVNAFTWTLRDTKSGVILAQETYHDFYGVTASQLADRIMARLAQQEPPQATPAPPQAPPAPNPQSPAP